MAKPPPDPLVAALNTLGPLRAGQKFKIETMFKDRGDILDGIRTAARNGASAKAIAKALVDAGHFVSEGAVRNWLERSSVS
jgi:hypothetical protein